MTITPGQIYQSCQPTYVVAGFLNLHTRIKVLEAPGTMPGIDFGKAFVATLTTEGRLLRMRHLDAKKLHASAFTKEGDRRRTGYSLVQDVVHLQQIGSTLRLCGSEDGHGHLDPCKVTCEKCAAMYERSGA